VAEKPALAITSRTPAIKTNSRDDRKLLELGGAKALAWLRLQKSALQAGSLDKTFSMGSPLVTQMWIKGSSAAATALGPALFLPDIPFADLQGPTRNV
jgi:hypothetical protein